MFAFVNVIEPGTPACPTVTDAAVRDRRRSRPALPARRTAPRTARPSSASVVSTRARHVKVMASPTCRGRSASRTTPTTLSCPVGEFLAARALLAELAVARVVRRRRARASPRACAAPCAAAPSTWTSAPPRRACRPSRDARTRRSPSDRRAGRPGSASCATTFSTAPLSSRESAITCSVSRLTSRNCTRQRERFGHDGSSRRKSLNSDRHCVRAAPSSRSEESSFAQASRAGANAVSRSFASSSIPSSAWYTESRPA